jgi:hypothetical protein
VANRVWTNRVRHVADGEPVDGATDGRPTRTLENNLQYIRSRIDDAELGEGVVAHDETVEPSTQIGMAVYRNAMTARYERALAAVEHDPPSGTLVPAPSADVVGVVLYKTAIDKADILLAGRGRIDLSGAVDGPPLPGRYYLSGSTPGMLVRQRPPVSVSVLVYTDDGLAVVQPVQRDFLEDHVHFRVRLHAQPAGDNGLVDGRRVVLLPDPDLPGWLPADHANFGGLAPAGAAFGYNLAAHPELARIFPPIPPSSSALFLDRGEGRVGGTLIPMGPAGLCVVDSVGIWWMSNCPGDVPWPESWTAPGPDAVPPNDPDGPECPRLEEFQLILAYTVMVFTTERTVVTSLRPGPNSPLRFTNCDGDDATTGDLQALIDYTFLVSPDQVDGSLVFKELDGTTFHRGRVIEGLRAGPGCELVSTNPKTDSGGTVTHQGVVEVGFNTSPGERELPADLIRLAQTQERYHLDVPYIGMDAGRDTSLRMRFYVPPDGLPSGPTVRIRMQLLGRATGTLPALQLSYRVLPRPLAATSLPGPSAERALTVVTTLSVSADQYVEVQSEAFAVATGDTILVQVARVRDDGYAGEVGLMRPVGILTGTAPTGG